MTLTRLILDEFEGYSGIGPQSPRRSIRMIHQRQYNSMTQVHPQHHPRQKEIGSTRDQAGVD